MLCAQQRPEPYQVNRDGVQCIIDFPASGGRLGLGAQTQRLAGQPRGADLFGHIRDREFAHQPAPGRMLRRTRACQRLAMILLRVSRAPA